MNHSFTLSFSNHFQKFKNLKTSTNGFEYRKHHYKKFLNRRGWQALGQMDYEPSQQVIDNILNYNKALEVLKTEKHCFFGINN